MEAMLALWEASQSLLGTIPGQADGASVVIGLGEMPALFQNHFGQRLYCGLIEACGGSGGLRGHGCGGEFHHWAESLSPPTVRLELAIDEIGQPNYKQHHRYAGAD